MKVIENAKIASLKETTCSSFIFVRIEGEPKTDVPDVYNILWHSKIFENKFS
jgi:hypothetical protein